MQVYIFYGIAVGGDPGVYGGRGICICLLFAFQVMWKTVLEARDPQNQLKHRQQLEAVRASIVAEVKKLQPDAVDKGDEDKVVEAIERLAELTGTSQKEMLIQLQMEGRACAKAHGKH